MKVYPMDHVNLVSSVIICFGAAVMAVNITRLYGVMQRLKSIPGDLYDSLKVRMITNYTMVVLFFVGYLVVLAALSFGRMAAGNFIVSIIFLFGAVFVLLGINLQNRMIQSIDIMYRDILETNRKLNRQITAQQEIRQDLSKSYDTQTVINKILKMGLSESTVSEIVSDCLDLILTIPWLAFRARGSVFLVENEPEVLVLKASKGGDNNLPDQCATVKFGQCLCGIAAKSGKLVHAGHIDNRHNAVDRGIPDHGHYCTPITARGRILGVINIHLRAGHEKNPIEVDFLTSVANTLAIVLMQKYEEQRNREMNHRALQSQKMEAMGTLAGGIAHDFNNILSGIFAYVSLAQRNLDKPDKVENHISQIHSGARRAADLVQQILTFSRQTDHAKTPLRLHLIIKEAVKFLRSSIPSSISIRENIRSDALVLADATHIHQIVINLCTNASHAMADGGTLHISLEEVTIADVKSIPDIGIRPGEYVRLEVADTGCGMGQDLLDRIFEPYFTTKESGEGTGLGLALVAGITKDHGGYVKVYSEVGKGSSFHVYFPVLGDAVAEDPVENETGEIQRGKEHILVVDDDDGIRTSTREILKDYGYEVTDFSNGSDALALFKKNSTAFDMMITDITMPGITGDKLINEVVDIRRDFPIIVCSGYSRAHTLAAMPSFSEEKVLKYFQKPVDTNALLVFVRECFSRQPH
ncbi:MAG TPA: hypothetical protein DHV36_19510 [Desulfobacteraceae bacterium]|nr:hypothetical protein [Desulfobacteraceae bacterium]